MQYSFSENIVSDLRIAYIGGGSRGWAWTFMTDLALEKQLSGEIRLYDIDREAAEANCVIGTRLMERPETSNLWRFTVSDTLKEALTGADFVVISILPGTFDEMEADVHMPERLNVWQSVGDTAGPGGIIRAMRTIPMFVEIAEAIRDFAPDAWVINYTNPMALCVRTLYTVFPDIKAFGCCHEVFGTQKVLAGIYEEETGDTVADWHDVHVNVLGLNHFTWFSEASYKGTDLFPIYRRYIEKHFEEGYNNHDENWMNSCFNSLNRVKMDLFLRYGWAAAAGDRHLVEFMPGNEYLRDPESVSAWNYALTPVSWRKEDLAERRARSARLVRGEEDIELVPTGEEGILLIKALCGLTRVISNVNIPNTSLQIPNLPSECVVETNAVFAKNHIHPVAAGPLKEDVRALILPHAENQTRTYTAAMTGDISLVVDAFLADPNFGAKCKDRAVAEALVRDMLGATAAYLPDRWSL